MNPSLKRVLAMCVLLSLVGCAVEYKRKTMWNGSGYSDEMIGDGVYRVTYTVDDLSPPEKALRYWHQHASELCNGAADYAHDETQTKQNHPSYNPKTDRYEDHYFSYVEGTVTCKKH